MITENYKNCQESRCLPFSFMSTFPNKDFQLLFDETFIKSYIMHKDGCVLSSCSKKVIVLLLLWQDVYQRCHPCYHFGICWHSYCLVTYRLGPLNVKKNGPFSGGREGVITTQLIFAKKIYHLFIFAFNRFSNLLTPGEGGGGV